ncbi:MAG: hypothetical protein U0234_26030 [Sandaracinus sp.]
MSSALTTLVLLVILSTSALCLFVIAVRAIRRDARAVPPLAWLPLATPVFSWREGHRGLALALAFSMLAYALVWAGALSTGVGS